MMLEERQSRAWARTVFRRAALRWLDRQRHQAIASVTSVDEEAAATWQHAYMNIVDRRPEDEISTALWLYDCRAALTSRDQQILDALYQGWTPAEVAQMLCCDVSTVRRAIYRIRARCPASNA